MAILLDGTGGVTTPGVVNTAGETIATTLSVTGASTFTGNVGIGTATPGAPLSFGGDISSAGTPNKIRLYESGTNLYGFNISTGALEIIAGTSGNIVSYINGTEQARIDSTGLFKFNSGYGSAATAYGCRAWVNFNGTGTVAIRASGNVSSITDNGTGDYTVNFTTAMPDANYSVTTGGSITGGSIRLTNVSGDSAPATSSRRVISVTTAGATLDLDYFYVAVFR